MPYLNLPRQLPLRIRLKLHMRFLYQAAHNKWFDWRNGKPPTTHNKLRCLLVLILYRLNWKV